jgi:tetratricopeptide (TPR) repeat protein
MSAPDPTIVDAAALLAQGETLHRQGRRLEAIDVFRQALAFHPDSTEGWYELGYLLKAEGKYEEAIEAYGEALSRGVSRPEEVHLNRSVIYADHLRMDDLARSELAAALAIAPDYVPALLNQGNLHEERGERDEALASYERIRGGTGTDYPDLRCEAISRTVNLRRPTDIDDPLIGELRAAASAGAVLGANARANALFALGQALDALGEFDQAFDAFSKANRCLLRQSGRPYDRLRSTRLMDAFIEAFPVAVAGDASAAPGPQPLFICGMFRSGSTLLEQVLATHPLVVPGGELDYLMRLAARQLAPFPQSMAGLDESSLAGFATEYRDHVARLFPASGTTAYVTDKRPDNFLLIGLIKRLFPHAKIIHTTRHPMDNGLSVFSQHLNHLVAPYSSDLGEIGHYYSQYRRLMAHWKTLYPQDIFDFDYDRFVQDPGASLGALFGFLDIPADEGYNDFHRLNNTVKTASYWQVRQPLHRNAQDRWRQYAAHLGPLAQALEEGGVSVAGPEVATGS